MLTTHVARNEELWDAFVQQRGGCFLQSWGWSEFQEAAGRQTYRFRIDAPSQEGSAAEHGHTLVQFLLVVHELPFGARYAYIPRGPVIGGGPGADREAHFEAFIGALRSTLDQLNCVFARIEFPYLQTGDLVGSADLERYGFRYVRSVQPADTLIVDLDRSDTELLAAMHPKTRYNIRVAEKRGVTVREAHYENAHRLRQDLDSFWKLLDETAVRDRFHTHRRDYYEKMLDVLSLKKGGGLRTRLSFACLGEEPVAACVTAEYGDTVTYLHGASAASRRSVMGPQLLHWRMMNGAKERGFAKYDFWGIAPDDSPEHPWAGITRFKKGFGGRRESYLGAWELSIDPIWYTLYRFAKRFRNV